MLHAGCPMNALTSVTKAYTGTIATKPRDRAWPL